MSLIEKFGVDRKTAIEQLRKGFAAMPFWGKTAVKFAMGSYGDTGEVKSFGEFLEKLTDDDIESIYFDFKDNGDLPASIRKNQAPGLERRSIKMDKLEVRAATADAPTKIVGHAAMFNSAAEICSSFREQIMPGAFTASIGEDDVRALFNHDPNYVLGRNTAGTLRMSEDDIGLAIEVDPPDTQWARDLMVSIGRGDISQMSFGFCALEETWDYAEDGSATRTLKKVRLFDVSPVTYPAYDDTDVAVRSLDEFRKANPKPADKQTQEAGYARTLAARAKLASIS